MPINSSLSIGYFRYVNFISILKSDFSSCPIFLWGGGSLSSVLQFSFSKQNLTYLVKTELRWWGGERRWRGWGSSAQEGLLLMRSSALEARTPHSLPSLMSSGGPIRPHSCRKTMGLTWRRGWEGTLIGSTQTLAGTQVLAEFLILLKGVSLYPPRQGGSGWSEHSNEVTIQSVTVYLLEIKVQANFIPFLHPTKYTT